MKKILQSGKLAIGHYVGEFATPGIGHILKQAGAEFAFLDMEHGGLDYPQIHQCLRYFEAAALPVMLRVPSCRSDHIARALDIGAEAIIVPMVSGTLEAKSIIASIKYAPQGKRGVALGIGNDRYRSLPVKQGLADANDRTAFIALIETREGLNEVEDIAALDGVDCLWVGHFDVSASLGIAGEFEHPDYLAAIERVTKAGKTNGKALGQLVGSPRDGVKIAANGWNMVCYNGDVWLYRQALAEGIGAIRSGAA